MTQLIKMTSTYRIEVIATNSNPPQTTVSISLETFGIIITSLLGIISLFAAGAKIVTRFNGIGNDIKNLRKDLASHSTLIEEFKQLQKDFSSLDKSFSIHQQDFMNHKDAVLLGFNGAKERTEHKWERTKEELEKVNNDVNDLQRYLHEQSGFIVRQRISLDPERQ
ncbi:hypothetical protein I8748_05500 [Nostoc sp. CENA67]|uniref:Uncharacterized protein n=1 Tax=Amazonocrinis nigriterrae CENA67 TaxID=2794033 RepID=A0A8J7L6T6_9NOST|nr:hypothetical protein [Amazonocrinis nigriterrae]MBH8561638.1 hypothetical protein [Amazonocrinis nigriterrae CENA67]